MCRRIFRCICNCKADKASSLHRNDCEVVERQECRHGRSRSTSTWLQKLDATPSFAVVDGAPKALDFRAVELSWRMVLGAASASGANPTNVSRNRRWPSLFSLKEELVEAAEKLEMLVSQGRLQYCTVDRAPVPQFLDETVELRLVPQERVQSQTAEQFMDVPQIHGDHADVVRLVPQERNAAGRRAKC